MASSINFSRFAIAAAWPLAVMLATLSLGGLLSSAAYAQETPAWTAQALGQDWFDLLVAAPWIALCGMGARHGSYRWGVLLAGAYAYTVYEMFIYAFAIHFNALFLLYCATLGVAGFALVRLVIDLHVAVERTDRRSAQLAGGFLILIGAAFGIMWLAEDIPAVLRGSTPQTLVETGLFTNPVHVIDLAIVLPAHVIAGVLVLRRTRAGDLFASILLAFGILMAASIGGMMVAMDLAGHPTARLVTIAMFAVATISAGILARVFVTRAHVDRSMQRVAACN